jgi:23S rRNA (uracil1939-C5)-methyltransferase
LQHLGVQSYYNHKQSILVKTIALLGGDPSVVRPIISVGEHSRRRVEFKVAVSKGVVRLGFFGAKSHDVFDLDVCLVGDKRLIALVPDLKACLQSLKKPSSIKAVALTALDNGFYASITCSKPLSPADREKLICYAKNHNFIRLNEQEGNDNAVPYLLYANGDAVVTLGKYDVKFPAGAFLQATEAGQAAITTLVTASLHQCEHVADLYSGCGTYSFPLIETVRNISAFEGSEDMVSAMHNAITHYGLEGKICVSVRDLFKHPLNNQALSHFDGVVINPPRNGALPQIKHIATSKIPNVVIVSCNPATFKRDAQWLLDSGYRITSATAIDQFYWTNHLEIVASFVLPSNTL